jgi:hypothetical protein
MLTSAVRIFFEERWFRNIIYVLFKFYFTSIHYTVLLNVKAIRHHEELKMNY